MQHIFNSSGYNVLNSQMVRAEDCYLFDVENNRYVDFESGVWCTALGHNHPRVNQAISRQMAEISHLGYRYFAPIVEKAAARVVEKVGLPEGKCIFLSSGSEAVEFEVQIARRLTEQPLLLTLSNSYLAAYGSAGKRCGEEWYLFDWKACIACQAEGECYHECQYLRQIPFSRIGGLVFEPGNSSGRVQLPPGQLVTTLARMIKEQAGLILVDEVTTGFGRTGTWFGFEHYDLKPDMVAMAKGIGNGYPVSAVAMSAEIAQKLEESQFRYAQSHQNDAWGCAIALEVINVIEDEGLIARSKQLGQEFLSRLMELQHRFKVIKEVRGRGLMIVLEFLGDENAFSLEKVHRALFQRGFLVGFVPPANLLRFYPPLTLQEKDMVGMVEALAEILEQMS